MRWLEFVAVFSLFAAAVLSVQVVASAPTAWPVELTQTAEARCPTHTPVPSDTVEPSETPRATRTPRSTRTPTTAPTQTPVIVTVVITEVLAPPITIVPPNTGNGGCASAR